MRLFDKVLEKSDIVFLQEVHGDINDFKINFSQQLRNFIVMADGGKDFATAGVATLIRISRFEDYCWQATPFGKADEAGRILLAEGAGPEGQMAKLWNVHNFGLSAGTITQVANLMQEDAIHKDIATDVMLWVGGDWNFLAEGENHLVLSRPDEGFREAPAELNPNAIRWTRALFPGW